MTRAMKAPLSLIGQIVDARAAAKLNLRLKIIGRREDGYHLLSMLNTEISLSERLTITFENEPGVRIEVGEMPFLADASMNLASRAADAYLSAVAAPVGISIRLQKKIPVGAGLGGGSSDAAAVLRALNSIPSLSNFPLSASELAQLALSLGADVPYFLQGGLCHVTGVGENVEFLRTTVIKDAPAILFIPSISISTPELYAFYRKRFPVIDRSSDSLFHSMSSRSEFSYSELINLIDNDFEVLLEEFASPLWEQICAVRETGIMKVGLTGSGSAFFGLPYEEGELAQQSLASFETMLKPMGTRVLAVNLKLERREISAFASNSSDNLQKPD